MNPRLLLSVLPVAAFYFVGRVADSWVAILAGFIAFAIVGVINRKDRLIGALSLFGFIVVGLSALVGIIWDSEKAYLFSGPLSDFLFIPLYLGSIAIKKPLIGGIARELFPAVAGKIPTNAPVFRWLSLAWAGYDLFHGLLRVYLLGELSVGEYIVWSRITSWPFTFALVAISVYYIRRAAAAETARQVAGQPGVVEPA